MGNKGRFEKLVERAPVDNDKLIGQAVSWFISKQEPDSVSFNAYSNGYTIKVITGEGGVGKAKEFWYNHVHQHLGGDE